MGERLPAVVPLPCFKPRTAALDTFRPTATIRGNDQAAPSTWMPRYVLQTERKGSDLARLTIALCILVAGCCAKGPPPRDFMQENIERWNGELRQAGGGWDAWEAKIQPFQNDVRAALASRPEGIDGIVGLDGFLFFRRSLEVLVGGDLQKQIDRRNPYPAIVDFQRQLRDRGVDLLFCPIPVKAAVFPEKVSLNAPPPEGPYVNVYTRKLMFELAEAGVECVDLLPYFMEARDKGGGEDEPFYMPLDTHWSHRALRVAARVFAERIKGYPWYAKVSRNKVEYGTQEATSKRRGDIVRMLPEVENVKYRPMTLRGEQVLKADGSFYEDDQSSPIVLLGDSYAGVFHLEDCKYGGLTAHIAKEIGIPLDLVLGQGMGPDVRIKWFRYRGKEALKGKKLVIWTLSERDLYGFRSPWSKITVPE